MNKLDFTSVSELKRLREEFESVINQRIEKAMVNEAFDDLSNLSFGSLKSLFESVSDKLYDTKGGCKLIRRYIQLMKENKDLNSLYTITDIIVHPVNITNKDLFMSHLDKLSENINVKNLMSGKLKLAKIIKECLTEAGVDANFINEHKCTNGDIYEAIEYVFSVKPTASNICEQTNKRDFIMNHIVCENTNDTNNDSVVEECANIKSLNDVFSDDLDEWEVGITRDLALCELADNDKSSLFDDYKNSCISIIDEILDDCDIETKSRFMAMKEQLETKKYNSETVTDDLLKLAELRYTLENN